MSFAASDSPQLAMVSAAPSMRDPGEPSDTQREAPLLSYLVERPCPLPSRIFEFLVPCGVVLCAAFYISYVHYAGVGAKKFGMSDPFILAGLGIALEQFWVRYRAFLTLTKLRNGGIFEQLMMAPGYPLRDWLAQLALAKERQSFPFRLGVIGGLTLSFGFWFAQTSRFDIYLAAGAIIVYVYSIWRIISYLDRENSFARGRRIAPVLMEVPVLFTRTQVGATAVALIIPAFTIAFALIITFNWAGLFLILGLFAILQVVRTAAIRMDTRQDSDPFESAMRAALKLKRRKRARKRSKDDDESGLEMDFTQSL